jgi:hypothetical protein
MLDHVFAAVAGGHQLRHQLVAIELLPGPHHHRLDVLDVGTEPLHQGPDRGDHHRGRPLGVPQAPQHARPATHGLDRRADALEGQRLPGGEQLHGLVAQVGGEVVRQPLGLGGGGDGEHDRAAGRDPGEPGGDDGPCRFAHGQCRRGAAEHQRQGRLVAQQARQVV